MWLSSEIDSMKKKYKAVDGVYLSDYLNDKEIDAIADSAIPNLKNSMHPPRHLSRFMTTVRMHYLTVNM